MADLKLNKQLAQSLADAGINELNEFQRKLVTRTVGGASYYLVEEPGAGPQHQPLSAGEGSHFKETAMIIAVLQKMNYSMPDTPRTIVVAATNAETERLHEKFRRLAKHTGLKILVAHEGGSLDHQNMEIYAGADIIIATPKRLIKLYFQCGINVNKVNTFILYNATHLADGRFHQEISRFTDSLNKFQGIVYTDVLSDKVKKLGGKFMFAAQVV